MASHTLRFRQANRNIFTAIRNGVKKVETRACSVRYQNIEAGDVLVFVCGKERFRRRVKRCRHFKGIAAMLRAYNVRDINPYVSSKKELEGQYGSFPDYKEKIRRFGLVAIELMAY